jgi:hypothetical protein
MIAGAAEIVMKVMTFNLLWRGSMVPWSRYKQRWQNEEGT